MARTGRRQIGSENSPVPDFRSSRQETIQDPAGAESTLEAAALLGRRTAELHLALSKTSDLPAFAPEPMTAEDLLHDAKALKAGSNRP